MYPTHRIKAFSSAPRRRRDWRWPGLLATLAAIALLGAAFAAWNAEESQLPGPPDPQRAPTEHAAHARSEEVRARFEQAAVMLHARQYEHAVTALHRVIELEPTLPEAHVNMGYAMLGLGRYDAARDFFSGATELRPAQANAYYGLAIASEALGDRPAAIGAMRTFVHLSAPDDPFVRKARAALWEWQDAPRPAPAGAGGRR